MMVSWGTKLSCSDSTINTSPLKAAQAASALLSSGLTRLRRRRLSTSRSSWRLGIAQSSSQYSAGTRMASQRTGRSEVRIAAR